MKTYTAIERHTFKLVKIRARSNRAAVEQAAVIFSGEFKVCQGGIGFETEWVQTRCCLQCGAGFSADGLICDGCDNRNANRTEPDFTLDDLEWSEEYQ